MNALIRIYHSQVFPLLLTLLLIIGSGIGVSGLLVNESLTIERNNVVIRQDPATDAKSLVKLEFGDQLHVLNRKSDWLYVRNKNNVEGWIPQWLLDNPFLPNEKDIAGMADKELTLLQSPEANAETLVTIPKETYFTINREGDGWTRVHYDNTYGFIPTKAIRFAPLADMEAAAKAKEAEPVDQTLIVRVTDQGFFDSPSIYGTVLYSPPYGQNLKYIDTTIDNLGNEWYLAQDGNGIRGYIESRITAFASDSKNHTVETKAKSLADATILLDPGHGGTDVGALPEATAIQEKAVTLQTALAVKSKLEEQGAKVIMTRDKDTWVDLNDRVTMSNDQEVDAFISIHYDASTDTSWNGFTTYYFHESDYDLAVTMSHSLSNLPLANNGAKFGNYQVIRENHHPALLLELGYLTNTNDLQTLQKADFNKQVADNIAQGLDNYFSSR